MMHNILLALIAFLLLSNGSTDESPAKVCPCDSPNVRTVLFKTTDLYKECWTDENLASLYARRLFQIALPKKVPTNMHLLVKYLKMCLSVVKKRATNKRAHYLMMSAMADTIGGYLQAFGLPLAVAEFYEGTSTYCTTRQIDELLRALKKLLNADGGGWTRPIYIRRSSEVLPFKLPTPLVNNLCPSLISSYDISAVSHCLMRPEDSSADLSCVINTELDRFNTLFHRWLIKIVLPHLHDEKWYPGFGSVHKILETMALRGLPRPKDDPRDPFNLKLWTEKSFKNNNNNVWLYIICVLAFLVTFWLLFLIISCIYNYKYSEDDESICTGCGCNNSNSARTAMRPPSSYSRCSSN